MEKFILTARFEIIPGFEEKLKAATINLAKETRKEKGSELFLIHTEVDSPQSVFIYEIYKSEEAFHQHKTFAYTEEYIELLKGKIENDLLQITFLTALNGIS